MTSGENEQMSLEEIAYGLVEAREAQFRAQLAPRIQQWGEIWEEVLTMPLTEKDFKSP